MRCGYFPDQQEWTAIPDAENPQYFIGIDPQRPPKPEDMARPTLHDGYLLPLKGQQWQIPVIRRPDGTTSLPRDMKLDFANPKQATETIAAEYEEIWADTAEAIDWLEGFNHDPPTVPPMGPAIHLCVRALGLNYRYGIAEQNLLSLANSQTYPAILSALADFPKFAADAQKKARTMARPTNP